MANNLIQIKRSEVTAAPASLANGELAWSGSSDVLYIGNFGTVTAVGGVRNPGVLTANQALVANSTSGIDSLITGSFTLSTYNITTIIDDDTFTTGVSNTSVATSESVKAYVDAVAGAGVSVLNDITDVNAATPVEGNVLTWDATEARWVDADIAGGNGITSSYSNTTDTHTISVLANNGIIANTTGVFVDGANGISVTTAGVNVLAGNNQITSNATGIWISSITAAQISDDIALGTDTSGNYVATIAGTNNEITVTGSGSETAAVTIGLPDSVVITDNLTANTITTNDISSTVGGELSIVNQTTNTAVSGVINMLANNIYDNKSLEIIGFTEDNFLRIEIDNTFADNLYFSPGSCTLSNTGVITFSGGTEKTAYYRLLEVFKYNSNTATIRFDVPSVGPTLYSANITITDVTRGIDGTSFTVNTGIVDITTDGSVGTVDFINVNTPQSVKIGYNEEFDQTGITLTADAIMGYFKDGFSLYTDNSSIDFNFGGTNDLNIDIMSDIRMKSGTDVNINAGDDVNINAADNVIIDAANNINLTASFGINIDASDDVNIDAADNINITAVDNVNIDAGQFLSLSGTDEVAITYGSFPDFAGIILDNTGINAIANTVTITGISDVEIISNDILLTANTPDASNNGYIVINNNAFVGIGTYGILNDIATSVIEVSNEIIKIEARDVSGELSFTTGDTDTRYFANLTHVVVEAGDTDLTVSNTGVQIDVGNTDFIVSNTGVEVIGDFDITSGSTLFSSSNTGVEVTGNVTITGDLTITGTTTAVNSTTLTVVDPLIRLADNNNTSDVVDIGFYGLYDSSGSQDLYAGFFRDSTDGKFRLFKDSQAEPTTTVNTAGAGFDIATLVAHLEDSNVSITGGSITGITDLAVADGGTGRSSFTTNGIIFGAGSSALSVTAAGTEGQVLQAGSGGTPLFATLDGGTF